MRDAFQEGQHRILGGLLHTKGVYRALFLGFQNVGNFELLSRMKQ